MVTHKACTEVHNTLIWQCVCWKDGHAHGCVVHSKVIGYLFEESFQSVGEIIDFVSLVHTIYIKFLRS